LDNFLISTIATTCNVDPSAVELGTRISDLNLDSLGLISIVSQLSITYDVEITADETMEFFEAVRIADVVSLARRITARAAVPS